MKTDRELLELAAKAAGITIQWSDSWGCFKRDARPVPLGCSEWLLWRPLSDDGDALRLAVKMDFSIEQNTTFKRSCVLAFVPGQESSFESEFFEQWAGDKQAATRRAIVCAAAEIAAQVAAQQNGEDKG